LCKQLKKQKAKKGHIKQVLIEPTQSALNMTLPAFAAERRRLQHGDGRHQSIALGALLQAPALSSKPVVAAVDRWDRRTDGRSPAYHAYLPRLGQLSVSV